ncbi:OLC1v1011759C1 [Oldenlandia corymbosa var. corymbosa]|uniref:Glycosyltransferase family 92 protein n=1 Tax=Oldenlandia corymbosa var. corymbosa TaxID=529605 RepID=A0AAV1DUE1_OLDCO|nr:OLC1v1011759C1 [Oldenlandia corymbosa var. corymbosa]
MKDHQHRKSRRRFLLPWIFLLCFLSAVISFHFFFTGTLLRPKLVTSSSLQTAQMEAIAGELSSPSSPAVSVQETVIFPDQVLLFLKYPPSTPLFTRDTIYCVYSAPPNSSAGDDDRRRRFQLPPNSVDDDYFGRQIVRCPLSPRGSIVSLSTSFNGNLPADPTYYRWDSLAYEAMIDRDNTTIVFVKGLHLRQGKLSDPTKFKCVYGPDSAHGGPIKFFIQSDVVSIAQEIVRCQTPPAVLYMVVNENKKWDDLFKVSVRMIGKRNPVKSVARLERRFGPGPADKEHEMCICTMLRNQAQFLREWVVYHSRIGVGRWFIYDNNSSDDIESVIKSLVNAGHKITRQVWPWIKTQEAGFAHCALRARDTCKWVGFIDVDEFFHLASVNSSLHDVLAKYGSRGSVVGEIRVDCLNFGPSGQKQIPAQGVTVGYTCRLRYPERHKSLLRPEAVNETLMSLVHHFHLKSGYKHVNLGTKTLVINHYKYQVWEVFKEKFQMRVATYVSDWQKDRNSHSKDRTPGLGTKAVEPRDWSSRFCEVKDTRLRDRVMQTFADPKTGRLPWQSSQFD